MRQAEPPPLPPTSIVSNLSSSAGMNILYLDHHEAVALCSQDMGGQTLSKDVKVPKQQFIFLKVSPFHFAVL